MPLIMIECPETKKPVPIGVSTDPSTFAAAELGNNYVRCFRCRQLHFWTKEDAWLKGLRGGEGEPGQAAT